VADNHYCVACTSPCKTCEGSQTNCTSCLSGLDPEVFLNNNICIDSCPSYTYANYSTNECSDCESPCYLCSSLSVCESCVSGYFYYNGTCEVDCPFGFIGIAKVCESCDSPCDGCEIAVDNCTSCIDGYYYVPNTNDC
jgi:proprotein convertase subtilisin/kexin type 5